MGDKGLKKLLSNLVFIDMKCEHVFVVGKKSACLREPQEKYSIFFAKVTFRSCYIPLKSDFIRCSFTGTGEINRLQF
jgi:hypothetical protein